MGYNFDPHSTVHFTSKIGVNLGLAVGIALWFSHVNPESGILNIYAKCDKINN